MISVAATVIEHQDWACLGQGVDLLLQSTRRPGLVRPGDVVAQAAADGSFVKGDSVVYLG